MKKLAIIALVVLASCKKEQPTPVAPTPEPDPTSISVSYTITIPQHGMAYRIWPDTTSHQEPYFTNKSTIYGVFTSKVKRVRVMAYHWPNKADTSRVYVRIETSHKKHAVVDSMIDNRLFEVW